MTSSCTRASRLGSAIAMALATFGLHAATITVNSDDDNPLSTACNLRTALKALNDGSTLTATNCSAAVSGDPFGTNDTIVFETDPAIATITLTQGELPVTASVLTINGSNQTIDAAGSARVLAIADGAKLYANNVYLTGGHSSTNGGGVSIGTGATAVFTSCGISANSTTAYGGGLYAAPTSTLKLINSIVSGNSALSGGGLLAVDSAVTLTNSEILYSTASFRGGGIYATAGSLTLDTSRIDGNSADLYGGGIVIAATGSLSMKHSTVFRNAARHSGGIFLYDATGAIATSAILGNTAYCGFFCAGAVYLKNSTLDVSDSTLNGNVAFGRANYVTGGVGVLDSVATIANSTITGNVGAGNGDVSGAVWLAHFGADTELTLINTTVSDNTAAAVYGARPAGGALLLAFSSLTPKHNTLTVINTILAANLPADTDIVRDPDFSTVAASYSLLGSAQDIAAFNDPGNHNVFSDSPGLGPLQDNGGVTATRALLPGSPALRAGSKTLAAFGGKVLNFDQRGLGYVRSFSGTVDIGAFEDQGDRVFVTEFESTP